VAAGQLRALLRSVAINGDAIAAGGGAPGAIYY
jgi:hypothetical protein